MTTDSEIRYLLARKATVSKMHRSRSATRFLVRITRQIHSDLSYHISKIRSAFENACVGDPREGNHVVEHATCASTRGIHSIPDSSWDNAIVARFSDASFCQVQEQLDGVTQISKSQQTGITAPAPGDAVRKLHENDDFTSIRTAR